MRPGVDVGTLDGLRGDHRADLGGDNTRLRQMRCHRSGRRELGGELPEAGVGAAGPDQREHGEVPEQGGPAVAEHDLVPVRQIEELCQAVPDVAHQVLDRRLPMRRTEQGRTGVEQGLHRAGPDLRGPAAEPTVGGQQLWRNPDVGHERRFFHGTLARPLG